MKSKMICNTVLPLMCTITITYDDGENTAQQFCTLHGKMTKIIIIIMTKVSIHEMG